MSSLQDIQKAVGGKFFRVVFIKRTTGEERVMHCRLGVQKHVSGKGARYNFSQKNLLSVWDLGSKGYRAVPVENILELRCGRRVWSRDAQRMIELSPEPASNVYRRPRKNPLPQNRVD